MSNSTRNQAYGISSHKKERSQLRQFKFLFDSAPCFYPLSCTYMPSFLRSRFNILSFLSAAQPADQGTLHVILVVAVVDRTHVSFPCALEVCSKVAKFIWY